MDRDWLGSLDPDSPPWVVAWQRETVDAYRAGDLEWLLERTDPEIEIVQPPEIPGARSYRGLDGLIDALLDWPLEWEDFSVEPKRIFAPGRQSSDRHRRAPRPITHDGDRGRGRDRLALLPPR